ncbi:MAG TPA: hypothetical protein HA367_04630 [Candidatus Methanofastidiosum sp.]|nr:hypothetical protein [Methanofastidiosum sp.]
MVELNMAYVTDVNFDVVIKCYITPAEMEVIVTNMVAEEDVFKRELLRKYYILKYCTDIEVDEDFDLELAVGSGLFEAIEMNIVNYEEVDDMIDKIENPTSLLKSFLTNIESKIPDQKTQKQMLTKLQKMSKEMSKNE